MRRNAGAQYIFQTDLWTLTRTIRISSGIQSLFSFLQETAKASNVSRRKTNECDEFPLHL